MHIEDILKLSMAQSASDLHILPGSHPMLRVHGSLGPIKEIPVLKPEETKNLIYSMLTPNQQNEFEKKLVLEIGLVLPAIGNFRVSILHQIQGIAAVFRLIPSEIPSFEQLMLPDVFKRFLELDHGLILVTGATGSGKSSTLAAMTDYINARRTGHIITIEDPIEYVHTSKNCAINQIQVGRDTHDMNTALKAALRQDPDVIVLGEMRDLESIRLSLTAAETGHLVMVTMHSSSAPLAINRIIDIFPAEEKNRVRSMLAETLQAIVCQTLVKKAGTGRVAAFEIMLANLAIRHLIRQDMIAHMESTMQTSGDVGMCTMDQYLHTLVTKKVITNATAKRTTSNWGHAVDDD